MDTTVKKNRALHTQQEIISEQQKLLKENNSIINDIRLKNERLLELNSKLTQEVNHYRLAEHRRVQTQQCVDFAVRSLPWWKRSMANVKLVTERYFAFIERHTEDLVSGDIAKQNQVL